MGWGKRIGIGCGALLVLVIVGVVILFFTVKTLTAGPEQVVRSFVDAAAAGDYARAHDYFSVPLKESQPLAAFTATVKANPSLFAIASTTFSDRSIDTSGAKLGGTVTLKAGTTVPASFSLVQENGTWKLISYHFGSKD
ncbi:MAG: hypothetical protein WCP29_02860 [Acidobacteriota bacterium]